jgi:hypothetical protein
MFACLLVNNYLNLFFLGCPWKGILNDLYNHLQNCFFDSARIPENMKNYINTLDMKENNQSKHQEEISDTYLNFNKNASLKARLFNKHSQLIISSMNNETKNKNFGEILGTDSEFLNEILNMDNNNNNINNINNINNDNYSQNSTLLNNNLKTNSVIGSKLSNLNENFQNNKNNLSQYNKNYINNFSPKSIVSEKSFHSKNSFIENYDLLRNRNNNL